MMCSLSSSPLPLHFLLSPPFPSRVPSPLLRHHLPLSSPSLSRSPSFPYPVSTSSSPPLLMSLFPPLFPPISLSPQLIGRQHREHTSGLRNTRRCGRNQQESSPPPQRSRRNGSGNTMPLRRAQPLLSVKDSQVFTPIEKHLSLSNLIPEKPSAPSSSHL